MICFASLKKIVDNSPKHKIVLFLRHAEKKTDGSSSLTDQGIKQTIQLASDLQKLNTKINIFSSPESRCKQTATIFHTYLGNIDDEIKFSNSLGKPGLQILDEALYEKLYNQFKCREIFHQWKQGLHYDVLRNPEQLLCLANNLFHKSAIPQGVTLYISQSGTVASLGYALNLVDYQIPEGEWVDFLDGFMLIMPVL